MSVKGVASRGHEKPESRVGTCRERADARQGKKGFSRKEDNEEGDTGQPEVKLKTMLPACGVGVPTEHPQQCFQCLRFYAPEFPCPQLGSLPRQAKLG